MTVTVHVAEGESFIPLQLSVKLKALLDCCLMIVSGVGMLKGKFDVS